MRILLCAWVSRDDLCLFCVLPENSFVILFSTFTFANMFMLHRKTHTELIIHVGKSFHLFLIISRVNLRILNRVVYKEYNL